MIRKRNILESQVMKNRTCFICKSPDQLMVNCPQMQGVNAVTPDVKMKKLVRFEVNSSITVRPTELSYIEFREGLLDGIALVDSGSQVSFISGKFLDQLHDHKLKPASFTFGGIESSGTCNEIAEFQIFVQGSKISVSAYVCRDMDIKADLLLGRDVNHRWIIDGRRNCVLLANGIEVPLCSAAEKSVNVILEDANLDLNAVCGPFESLLQNSAEIFMEPDRSRLPSIE
jgi:hypothetical protein